MKKDAAVTASSQPFLYQLETTQQRYNYFNSKSILDLHKHDVPMALMEAGCSHLSIKIFQYLDSASLLAASLVCLDWQQVQNNLSFESFTRDGIIVMFFMKFFLKIHKYMSRPCEKCLEDFCFCPTQRSKGQIIQSIGSFF